MKRTAIIEANTIYKTLHTWNPKINNMRMNWIIKKRISIIEVKTIYKILHTWNPIINNLGMNWIKNNYNILYMYDA